jgi:hypothetical protein
MEDNMYKLLLDIFDLNVLNIADVEKMRDIGLQLEMSEDYSGKKVLRSYIDVSGLVYA